MKKILLTITFLFLSVSFVNASQIFYGVRGSYGVSHPADLITIDAATGGLISEIGLTGLTGVGGFAINPLDGMMYASGGGDGSQGLYSINPLTGLATYIGGGVTVKDMGFDSSGTLFGVMADDGSGVEGQLATIDLTTGDITSIGGSFGGGIGLAFDSNDTLYIKERDSLYTVDSVTASILSTVTLDRVLHNSLAIDSNDTFYSQLNGWDTETEIFTLNSINGVTTILSNTVPALEDGYVLISAFDFSPGQPIPEPTTILLFGLGILGFAGVTRKKTA